MKPNQIVETHLLSYPPHSRSLDAYSSHLYIIIKPYKVMSSERMETSNMNPARARVVTLLLLRFFSYHERDEVYVGVGELRREVRQNPPRATVELTELGDHRGVRRSTRSSSSVARYIIDDDDLMRLFLTEEDMSNCRILCNQNAFILLA